MGQEFIFDEINCENEKESKRNRRRISTSEGDVVMDDAAPLPTRDEKLRADSDSKLVHHQSGAFERVSSPRTSPSRPTAFSPGGRPPAKIHTTRRSSSHDVSLSPTAVVENATLEPAAHSVADKQGKKHKINPAGDEQLPKQQLPTKQPPPTYNPVKPPPRPAHFFPIEKRILPVQTISCFDPSVYFSGWFVHPGPPGGSSNNSNSNNCAKFIFGEKKLSSLDNYYTEDELPSSDNFFTTTLTAVSTAARGGHLPEKAADIRTPVVSQLAATSSTSARATSTPENAGGLFSTTLLAAGENINMKKNEIISIYSNDTENLFLEKKFEFNGTVAAAAGGATAVNDDFHHNRSSSEEEALQLSTILFDKTTSVTLSVDEQSGRGIEVQVVQFQVEKELQQAHPFCTSSRTTLQPPQMKQLLRIKPDIFLSIETTTTFVGKVVRKNENSLGGRLSSKEVYVDSLAYAVLYHNQLARYKFASRDEQFLKKHNLLPETSVEEERVRVMYCDIDLEVGDMVFFRVTWSKQQGIEAGFDLTRLSPKIQELYRITVPLAKPAALCQ
ncbi:unnamed protein product [Amoebophrya sp. A120]|nr:unnamed protein product [Amoebophrya sp. A120]|eukprot:GSA120T00021163001.1